jgi:hypothetical protein
MEDRQNGFEIKSESDPQPRKKRHRQWWLLALPLLAWLACLGLVVNIVTPLVWNRQTLQIPVTGGDPTLAAPQEKKTVTGAVYMGLARQRLASCTGSFHDYFILEQLVIDQPAVFTDDAWRTDVTDAMEAFRDDCQRLGSLPSAPTAFAEVDHWLKLAAGEVGPSTDSLTRAIDKEQAEQFRVSIQHLLKFVDYIHQAEGAMDGLQQRKEI